MKFQLTYSVVPLFLKLSYEKWVSREAFISTNAKYTKIMFLKTSHKLLTLSLPRHAKTPEGEGRLGPTFIFPKVQKILS